MKVFISHSSKDKWAARKISEDLEKRGIQSFLDEKDIATGSAIDTSIQEHLGECNDFLILLSPASIASAWVLVELGGAIALKKNLVPILLYIGPNEIPPPITKYLARDINELDKYYDELVTHAASPMIPPPARKRGKKRTRLVEPIIKRFRVGDIVLLPSVPQEVVFHEKTLIDWNNGMDEFLGKRAEVTLVDPDGFVRVDVDGEKWAWAHQWLNKPHDT